MDKSIIKPGVIFYSSWGYEQTNVSFYQVVTVIGKCTVAIRELSNMECIKNTRDFSSTVMPSVSQIKGDLVRKRVLHRDGEPFLKISDCERAYLWDGTSKYASSYE